MEATLTKIRERVSFADAASIDAEAGYIRGVTLLGSESKNGRRYTEAAMRKAAQLYVGQPINVDHGDTPGGQRSVMHRGGWIESANYDPATRKVKGDVGVLLKSSGGQLLMEIAQRKPTLCGFSHDVEGELVDRGNGLLEVTDIHSVNSVDAVDRPATTKNLFESVSMNLTEYVQKLDDKEPLKGALTEAAKEHGTKVVEGTAQQVLLSLLSQPEKPKSDPAPTTLKHMSEAVDQLVKEVKGLVEWKRQREIEHNATSVLQEHLIDPRPELLKELHALETREAMQERVALWPDYVREPLHRPLIESEKPEDTESQFDYDSLIKQYV